MLNLITLQVIDKIFSMESAEELSNRAKSLYINCLMHHFRGKAATVTNATAFDLFKVDIRNWHSFESLFVELYKSDLVVISNDRVTFNNVWGQLIDRTKLDKVSPEMYVGAVEVNGVDNYLTELLTNQSLYEMICMRHKIKREQFESLAALFAKEQKAFGKKYMSLADCTRHFAYWIPTNLGKPPIGNHVKSSSTLLGE